MNFSHQNICQTAADNATAEIDSIPFAKKTQDKVGNCFETYQQLAGSSMSTVFSNEATSRNWIYALSWKANEDIKVFRRKKSHSSTIIQ